MKNRRSVILWSAAIALLYAIMAWLQPYALDDIAFRKFFDSFRADPSLSSFFEDACAAITHQFEFDSLRFSNAAVSLLMLFPAGIPAIVLGASLYLTLIAAWRLCGKQLAAFGVFAFLYMMLPPWREYMLTKAFGFNYVTSSAIALCLSVAVLKNNTRPLAAIILGFLAGMWHEGFTAAMIGGTVCLLFIPRYRNATTFSWLFALCAAIVVLALTPGTSYRGNGMFMPQNLFKLQHGLLTGASFYLFILFSAIIISRKKLREHFLSPEFILICGSATAGWVVWRCFMTDYRTAWPMILYSCCGLAYLCSRLHMLSARLGQNTGTILLALTVIQLILCLPYALRLNNEYRIAEKAAADGGTGHFVERSCAATVPRYTLNRVNFDIYLLGGYPVWQCIPAELADFSPEEATPLDSPDGAMLYRGLIVVPAHYGPGTAWICSITAGRTFETVCLLSEFTNGQGTFCYAAPLNLYQLAAGHPLTGFTLIREDL